MEKSDIFDRTMKAVRRLRSKNIERGALLLAAIVFSVGLFYAIRAYQGQIETIVWSYVVAVLGLAVPIAILLNAAEIVLSGRLIGIELGLIASIRISLLSSAANMLPLPGGPIVRTTVLKRKGATVGAGALATLFPALVWAAVSATYSGAWVLGSNAPLGIAFLVGGVGLGTGVVLWGKRRFAPGPVVGQIFLLKTIATVVDVASLWACFQALSLDISFATASVLALSSVLGSAVAIVPAGLGIREGAAVVLFELTGNAGGAAFLATALLRIIFMVALIPVSVGAALKAHRREASREAGASKDTNPLISGD